LPSVETRKIWLDTEIDMPTGQMGRATPMSSHGDTKGRFMQSALNRLIIWSAALLVIVVVGFGAYYYVDQSQSGDSSLSERELTLAEQAVTEDPTNIVNRLVLADLYYGRGRYEEAVTQYDAAVQLNDQSPLAHVGLDRALIETGEFERANENFQAVIDLSQEEDISGKLVQSSYYYLGSMALDQGKPDEAVAHFQKATDLERSDADAWYMLGIAYKENGQLDEAVDALQSAVAFVPDFAEAYEVMAEVFEESGSSAGVAYADGMAAYARGDLGTAADKLEQAIAESPTMADAHVGLGLVREGQGQDAAAIVAYQEALHLRPDDFLATSGLARLTGVSAGSDLPAAHPATNGEGTE
jgi:tetratricopeptide (TPR) repeat protein